MYKLLNHAVTGQPAPFVIKLDTTAYIPFDPDNTDYQAYLKWLEAGNTPLPADTGA